MSQIIGALTLLVADYDQAITFFTQGLGFALLEDSQLEEPGKPGKRWVRVAPPGTAGTALLLAKAVTPAQQAAMGQQGGGRVLLFLETDDFWGDYQRMQAFGVHFCEQPRHEPYGTVVVFEDISGNRWDLLQRTAAN
jgi:catechol 2,3-dioxygenase-like lactoylglutathione lyase family enzyme